MDGNNDPNKKVPDSGRTRIYKKDLPDPKRIDNFSDRIKREQERMKQNQSSSSKSGQGSSK
uniref:hypothetical protein n=1 Tax=Wolbachia endosymbiont (group B) of Pilophorus perplexus TaxID=3066160 RepID=UPI00333E21B5